MTKPDGKDTLGIYISTEEICISEIKAGGNARLKVSHLVKLPTRFTSSGNITRPLSANSEFFSEKAQWVTSLRQALERVNWDASRAVVTLSPQFAILRYFIMPVMDRKFWSRSIPLESKKYIPVSFDEVVYDFAAEPIEGSKKLGVLFGLTQRKSVEFLTEFLNASGLQLASIELNSCSLERLFAFLDYKDHASRAYIHFSGPRVLTLFSSGGNPVLYREKNFDDSSNSTERKHLDINGALQFVERYIGRQSYSNLMLSGDAIDAWTPLAAQESSIPPLAWDPAAQADLKDNDSASLFSVGAALKGVAPGKITLDLSGISTVARLEQKVQRYVWSITFVVCGILLFFSFINQAQIFIKSSKISGFKARLGDVSELQGLPVDTIRQKISKLQENGITIQALLGDSDCVATKMQAIADSIPAQLWLTGMQYSNPISLAGASSAGRSMSITGETTLKGEVKGRAVNGFLKSLKASGEFGAFGPPNGSMNYTMDSEKSSYNSPENDAGTTGFTIDCAVKRRN